MAYATAAVLAGTALYNYFDSSSRKKKADKALKELQKRQPRYATLQDAEGAIRQGFSAEERNALMNQITRTQNQGYRLVTQTNPNLASAVTAGMNYTNVGALADFASRDAALRKQRQQLYLQRSDLETQRQIREKEMMEQQYGLASSQAGADMSNSIGQLGYGFATMYASTDGAGIFGWGNKKDKDPNNPNK